jgi:MFS superfamily sulfate permease-like transporter
MKEEQGTFMDRVKELGPKEFTSSVVVFLVALPLCMGIAIASNVPVSLGLISGIIGGLVVGTLAGSPLQVSGPAAGLAVIVFELVKNFGLKALGVIVLFAGLLQLTAGLMKLGRWFQAVSPAVIHGMLAGIGVLIFGSQFHVMVDDKPASSGLVNLQTIPGALYKGVFPMDGNAHHLAAAIGLITIVTLVLWAAFRPKKLSFLPGPLVALIIAVVVSKSFGMPIIYITDIPANLFGATNTPELSAFSLLLKKEIWIAIVAMAVVASAESLLCASAVDQMHQGVRTNYDRELVAQGVGNMVAGAFGALPITGVIVRSSANVESGAKTRASAILHGIWLLAFVMALPFVLRLIPKSALAAILVYIGYRLVNIKGMKELWKTSRSEFAIYFITMVSIVSIDLLSGVMIGVALSVLKLVYVFSHLEVTVERREEEKRYDIYLVGSATFVRLPKLTEAFEALPRDGEIHIHLGGLSYVDHACLELFEAWEKQLAPGGGELVVEWDTLRGRFHHQPLLEQNKRATGETPAVTPEAAASSSTS